MKGIWDTILAVERDGHVINIVAQLNQDHFNSTKRDRSLIKSILNTQGIICLIPELIDMTLIRDPSQRNLKVAIRYNYRINDYEPEELNLF